MASPPPLPPLPTGGSGGTKKKPRTPAQSAARSRQVKQQTFQQNQAKGIPSSPTDPYVTINAKGNLVTVSNSKQALHGPGGRPLTYSQAVGQWRQYNKLWFAYLGRAINSKEFTRFIGNSWTPQQILTGYLMNRPNFTKSPVWKQYGAEYGAMWHSVYGDQSKPDEKAIKYAIAYRLDSGAFQDMLRHRPDYVSSEEYKKNFNTLGLVYEKVFGNMQTPQAQALLRQATLGNWGEDQFYNWLRHRPEWKNSQEAQGVYRGFLQRTGLDALAGPISLDQAVATNAPAGPLSTNPTTPAGTTHASGGNVPPPKKQPNAPGMTSAAGGGGGPLRTE